MKVDWNSIKSSYCSKRSPLVVGNEKESSAIHKNLESLPCFFFYISPYCVELLKFSRAAKASVLVETLSPSFGFDVRASPTPLYWPS